MKISFDSHGYKLAGNLFEANKPGKLALLFIQGWMGHQNIQAAELLAKMGITSMTYDMRGNGESEGDYTQFSRKDYIDDSAVAYDFFKSKLPQGTKIGVAGSSFGSYTGILLTRTRPVACLSLRVPASYPDEGYDRPQQAQKDNSDDFYSWREKALDINENHALKALHAYHGFVQIIEAEKDELVTWQAVKNYTDAVTDKSKLEHLVIKGAPHRLATPELQAEYEKHLSTWIHKVISKV